MKNTLARPATKMIAQNHLAIGNELGIKIISKIEISQKISPLNHVLGIDRFCRQVRGIFGKIKEKLRVLRVTT
jgi:hypothetical protein